jgi:hypothetical protein
VDGNSDVNLKPTLLYRLRLLAGTPRYYAATATTKQLLKLGLIEATGRVHPDSQFCEYALTEAGRRSLARRETEDQ